MECTRHQPLPSVIPGGKIDIFTTKLMTYVALTLKYVANPYNIWGEL